MADLNTDDAVWMDDVSDPSILSTYVAVEVKDYDEGDLESEIIDRDTFMPPSQADNVWVNG